MKILLVIIVFHLLAILRAKWTPNDKKTPYLSVLVISGLLTGAVLYMLMIMEPPTP
jgi:4-amino-4-deoxy-L-arabinose transferase-like glycosyltransferase